MLRNTAAFALALGCGLACAACGSSDDGGSPGGGGGSGTAGAAGTAGQSDDDAGPDAAENLPAHFTDANLEQCVRTALQMPEGDIYPDAFASLDHLECQDNGIVTLDGLENAKALVELSLFENAIVDITPLASLTQLRDLQLGKNQIQDISALSGMTGLRRLGLSINQIAGLQPLAGLTTLEWLNLDRNAIGEGELVHLAGLTNLRWLTIEHNGIQNSSSLQPLIDAGCDLYDHNAKQGVKATGLLLSDPVARPAIHASDVRPRIDGTGNVAFSYELGGKRLPGLQISNPVVRLGDRLVHRFGDRIVEVGRMVDGTPVLCEGAYARTCQMRVGVKWPEAGPKLPGTGDRPIVTVDLELLDAPKMDLRDGETWTQTDLDLLPSVLASPNQFDAGSCIFMANTGAVEILMNQHVAPEIVQYQGDTDLSERFLMNAYDRVPVSAVPYFLTDLVYTFEGVGGALLNRDYPFCAGYVVDTATGYKEAEKSTPNAYVSIAYNWFDKLPADWQSLLVATPPVERTSIYVDPKRDDNSYWRVALFNGDTIDQIKYELRTKNAPVIIVYNHYGYWHSNIIVGYDDTESSSGCPMVKSSVSYFQEQGWDSYANAIIAKSKEDGGCSLNGVFYVRDSIYDGTDEESEYDYSTPDVHYTDKYSKRITKLSYNWARYLANHAYTINRK